jgi:hypothetical protein
MLRFSFISPASRNAELSLERTDCVTSLIFQVAARRSETNGICEHDTMPLAKEKIHECKPNVTRVLVKKVFQPESPTPVASQRLMRDRADQKVSDGSRQSVV